MTIRQSLENLTHSPSADNWGHDPHSVEMQPAPIPRLSANEWRTSADDAIRPTLPAENPFQDPIVHHDEEPIQHVTAAHTHQSHAGPPSPPGADVEAGVVPKAPGTPSITALPLHLPYVAPRSAYPQTFHRIFLFIRLFIQILLFVLALIGFLLKYPKQITYVGMLTGNALAFVLVWAALLVLVYFLDGKGKGPTGGMRMSRYTPEREQWGKCVRMVVFDLMIVFVWLLVCWGNTGMLASPILQYFPLRWVRGEVRD